MMSLANVIVMKEQYSEEETRKDSIAKSNCPSKATQDFKNNQRVKIKHHQETCNT